MVWLPDTPLESLVVRMSMVSLPSSLLSHSVVDCSLPPRNSTESQLPTMVSHESLYIVLSWAMVWRMMLTLTLRERIVAMSLSKLGMRPTLANSSRKQCNGVARHSPG